MPATLHKKFLLGTVFAGVFAALLLGPFETSAGSFSSPEDPLYKAFSASGGKLEGIEALVWARVNEEFLPVGELARMAEQGSSLIREREEPERKVVNREGAREVTVDSVPESNYFHSLIITARSIKTYPNKDSGRSETYLIGRLAGKGDPASFAGWQDRMAKLYERYAAEPELFLHITGSFPGKLSRREREEIADRVLRAAGARRVESYDDGELISISAYTPFISQSARAAGRKINLNLAIRYHSSEERTFIELGVPLLEGEY